MSLAGNHSPNPHFIITGFIKYIVNPPNSTFGPCGNQRRVNVEKFRKVVANTNNMEILFVVKLKFWCYKIVRQNFWLKQKGDFLTYHYIFKRCHCHHKSTFNIIRFMAKGE